MKAATGHYRARDLLRNAFFLIFATHSIPFFLGISWKLTASALVPVQILLLDKPRISSGGNSSPPLVGYAVDDTAESRCIAFGNT